MLANPMYWTVNASLLAQMVAQTCNESCGYCLSHCSLASQSMQSFSHFSGLACILCSLASLCSSVSDVCLSRFSAARLPLFRSLSSPLGPPVSHSSLSQSFVLPLSLKHALSFSSAEKPVGSDLCRFRRSSWGRIQKTALILPSVLQTDVHMPMKCCKALN